MSDREKLCGGYGTWHCVAIQEEALMPLENVRVIVFEPKGAPATEKMVYNREVPTMTAGRAALVELMHRYLGGLLDPFVTLQKGWMNNGQPVVVPDR